MDYNGNMENYMKFVSWLWTFEDLYVPPVIWVTPCFGRVGRQRAQVPLPNQAPECES